MEILVRFLMIVTYVAIPCLALLAYRGWAKHLRQDLPRWRSFLGVASIIITLLNWLALAYPAFMIAAHLQADFFTAGWTVANIMVALIGAAWSLALKGRPRVCAFLAGCLMASPWLISYLGDALPC